MKSFRFCLFLLIAALSGPACAQNSAELLRGFQRPPEAARPWVYWFWLNGNITREGITADLEAMKRAGIGGVLIMEVDQGAPRGPVDFMSAQWREMFKHVISEGRRLGLEVNMNDDAGWNGSGGPWITPEQSMQKLVWSETAVEGGKRFEGKLPQPPIVAGFYRDIAVQAFPTPGAYRIPDIETKAAFKRGYIPPQSRYQEPDTSNRIPRTTIKDLTDRMSPDGTISWDAPEGTWTILRIGHTSTGAQNAPAPESGRGLECDKLSREGIAAQFGGMMSKLVADNRYAVGKTLVATHVDSWENGMQNWTARMREEFRSRRGYDLTPFLPVVSGRVVESMEVSERFLWDFRQTIGELVVDNYAGHLRELAHRSGMRLTIEAYDGPCDDMTFAGRADEPMSEFWIGAGAWQTGKAMASAAHTYGKRILGAEAFTADNRERWQEHPGSIKALGDRAFCEGINRFVFHRYAMQPWLDYSPGMTMGPWGLHYERTNTWWEQSRPWHEYLARCQYLLRQGIFAADICYLQPEASPQGFQAHPRRGYDYDNCTPEVVLTRMSVKGGRIALPEGMSYRILVLPDVTAYTPALLRKIRDLVKAGATVIGRRPEKSPGMSDYPACDDEVKRLSEEIWGDCDGDKITEHALGEGRVLWPAGNPEDLLAKQGVPPDFTSPSQIRWIHRQVGDTDIYFVANGSSQATEAVCTFRVTGKRPELWDPESGQNRIAPAYEDSGAVTRVPVRLGPSGSVFVIFRPQNGNPDPIIRLSKDGKPVWPIDTEAQHVSVRSAQWGPAGDEKRTKDVRAQVQRIIDTGVLTFRVADLASDGDPALNIVKTLAVEYQIGDRVVKASATDPEVISFEAPGAPHSGIELRAVNGDGAQAEITESGSYEVATRSGRTLRIERAERPDPLPLNGPWEVHFPMDSGAPEKVSLDRLVSWSESSDPAIKYFSGTARYVKTFEVPAGVISATRRIYLDIGKTAVMAQVTLNGRNLGILWKSPYKIDVTEAVRPGQNRLEIQVTSLPINRMIGDERLPDDSVRNPDGTLKAWPAWVQEGKPSPTGRRTFTSWRLWKGSEKLTDSGLLGPVELQISEIVTLK